MPRFAWIDKRTLTRIARIDADKELKTSVHSRNPHPSVVA
jgi:hypothetical protein